MHSISIVTVVFNGKDLLPGTIESVKNQTWPHIDYLIMDGGSTDGTVEIIKSYAAQMSNLRWVSERDNGLYDAMNKGMQMASGEFIQFLNAGDWLHDPGTIATIMAQITDETDVLFGETMLVDNQRRPAGLMSALSTRQLPASLHWSQYLNGMLVVHQSFIPRRSKSPHFMTDNLCADFDWCIRILKNSHGNQHTHTIITDYLMGGMSKKRHRESLKDRFVVMKSHFGLFPTLLAHGWFLVRATLHRIKRWGRAKY